MVDVIFSTKRISHQNDKGNAAAASNRRPRTTDYALPAARADRLVSVRLLWVNHGDDAFGERDGANTGAW